MQKNTIQTYLTFKIIDGSIPAWELADHLPPGWKKLVKLLAYYEDECHALNVNRVEIVSGLLRISYNPSETHPEDWQILEILANDAARESAITCIICGNPGVRRKLEENWPCFCKTHYLEYVNSE